MDCSVLRTLTILLPSHTGLSCCFCNCFGYCRSNSLVKCLWNDIIFRKFFIRDQSAIAFAAAIFIFLIDITCSHIKRTSEHTREYKYIVDLIREIRTSCCDDSCATFSCFIRHDLRCRVCHCKYNRIICIVLTISAVTIFGADTPTKISLPFMAALRSPCSCSLFVFLRFPFCAGFIHSSPGARIPLRSTMTTSPIPSSRRSLQMEIPADPAPLMTTFASENFFPTSLRAIGQSC